MNASTEFKSIMTTRTETIWSTFVTQTDVYRNISAPNCTISPRQCSVLQAEYEESSRAYYALTANELVSQAPTEPVCGSPIAYGTSVVVAAPACAYAAATVQLL
jgi:hypothetical protein